MAALTDGASGLMTVVTDTKAAVEAGDFAKAQTEFAKFGEAWATTGESIKTASPQAHAAIEQGVTKVNEALSAAQPDQAQVMDALTSLAGNLTGTAKP
jgi:ribosomal protein S20